MFERVAQATSILGKMHGGILRPTFKRVTFAFAYLAFVSVVAILGLEVLLASYHYLVSGELLWLRAPRAGGESSTPLAPQQTRHKLISYLGYSLRPRWKLSENADLELQKKAMGYSVKPEYWDWSANNLGFLSDRDYPYTPENDRDEFIVGITGGSVANGLALESSKDIAQIINSLPGFARKKVVILNLCGGGYHQPQQLLTVSYLISRGQRFDLIINLDGFNEAYIGWENAQDHKVHATEPAAKFVFGLQNQLLSVHSDAAKKVFAIRAAKEAAQRKMAATRSALAYYAAWVGSRRLVEGE